MKIDQCLKSCWIYLTLLFCMNLTPIVAQTESSIVLNGEVKDRSNRRSLENVNVYVKGTNIGTVTNADGTFSLKIPNEYVDRGVDFSHIGFLNKQMKTDELRQHKAGDAVWMVPVITQLEEVVILSDEARNIVEAALAKVVHNYPTDPNMLSSFYRETIQKGRRYISISEAMMNVYKTGYNYRTVQGDRVQLQKGRRLLSQKPSDTLAVKVVGGPNLAMNMDFVKNSDALFDDETIEYYIFEQEPSVMIDNRMQFVISFRPRVIVNYALLEGKLYIDRERLAFTRAELSLDMSDRIKAESGVLHKKPYGLRFRLNEVNFLITYRQQGEKTYLNYINNTIRFKCDWKRRLFSSTYTAVSELVIVDREENPVEAIRRRDAFKKNEIFYDVVLDYWNEDYWKDYNIIEPTESLEKAVNKLKKQQ